MKFPRMPNKGLGQECGEGGLPLPISEPWVQVPQDLASIQLRLFQGQPYHWEDSVSQQPSVPERLNSLLLH